MFVSFPFSTTLTKVVPGAKPKTGGAYAFLEKVFESFPGYGELTGEIQNDVVSCDLLVHEQNVGGRFSSLARFAMRDVG